MRDISPLSVPAAALAQARRASALVGRAVALAGLTAALQTREGSACLAQDTTAVAGTADQRDDLAACAGELPQDAIGHRAPATKA